MIDAGSGASTWYKLEKSDEGTGICRDTLGFSLAVYKQESICCCLVAK